jgi:hypothetical protein
MTPSPRVIEHLAHLAGQGGRREGLLEKRRSRIKDAEMGDRVVCVDGHVEHFNVRSKALDHIGQGPPVHVRHHNIGEKEMDRTVPPLGEAERVLGILTFQHYVSLAREDVVRQGAKVDVVFDEQDDLGPSPRCPLRDPGRSPPGDPGPGQVDVEGRPAPRLALDRDVPAALVDDAVRGGEAEPRALAAGFVVKNGSKMRDTVAASIPTPVSVIERTSYAPGSSSTFCRANTVSTSTWRVWKIREPPPGIASRELTAMLRITCSSCPGSAVTLLGTGSKSMTTSTSSPSTRGSRVLSSETISLRSVMAGLRVCLRLKAKSWRVRAAAMPPLRERGRDVVLLARPGHRSAG